MEESYSGNDATIVRDYGYKGWINIRPSSDIDMEFGYSRSVSYALNAIFFSVEFDVGSLLTRK